MTKFYSGTFTVIDWCPPTTNLFISNRTSSASRMIDDRLHNIVNYAKSSIKILISDIGLEYRADGIFVVCITIDRPVEYPELLKATRLILKQVKVEIFSHSASGELGYESALETAHPVFCAVLDQSVADGPGLPDSRELLYALSRTEREEVLRSCLYDDLRLLSMASSHSSVRQRNESAIDTLLLSHVLRHEDALNRISLANAVNRTEVYSHISEAVSIGFFVSLFVYFTHHFGINIGINVDFEKRLLKSILSGIIVSIYFYLLRRTIPLTSSVFSIIGESIQIHATNRGFGNTVTALLSKNREQNAEFRTSGFAAEYFDNMIKVLEEIRERHRQKQNRAILSSGLLVAMIVIISTIGLR